MDGPSDEGSTLIVHTERTTISEGRYLIYYTFTRSSAEGYKTDAPETPDK